MPTNGRHNRIPLKGAGGCRDTDPCRRKDQAVAGYVLRVAMNSPFRPISHPTPIPHPTIVLPASGAALPRRRALASQFPSAGENSGATIAMTAIGILVLVATVAMFFLSASKQEPLSETPVVTQAVLDVPDSQEAVQPVAVTPVEPEPRPVIRELASANASRLSDPLCQVPKIKRRCLRPATVHQWLP